MTSFHFLNFHAVHNVHFIVQYIISPSSFSHYHAFLLSSVPGMFAEIYATNKSKAGSVCVHVLQYESVYDYVTVRVDVYGECQADVFISRSLFPSLRAMCEVASVCLRRIPLVKSMWCCLPLPGLH